MSRREQLKQQICTWIDAHADEIIFLAQAIHAEPELGYKEFKTAKKVSAFFERLDIPFETGLGVTGIKGKLSSTTAGPNLAILGEMDGVICVNAPGANPSTGASHTCGHHLQIAGMLGAALGLKLSNAMNELSGSVSFIAVPAEEYIEIEERQRLRAQGKVHFLAGKQQLIQEGAFDDVDLCMMFHSLKSTPESKLLLGSTSNGFLGKTITYTGIAAHAAEAPDEGINALNAALLGISGINALRETFREEDHIRVHPVITKGGDTVNSIPSEVKIETYVRASNIEALTRINQKVDRALLAGGYALGAKVEILTNPGHMPMKCSELLNEVFMSNALECQPDLEIGQNGHFNASTDFGDLSHLMPAIHSFVGGVRGQLHTKEFEVANMHTAVLLPAKAMAMTAVDLLSEQATLAKEVMNRFEPSFPSKEMYLKFLNDSFERKVQE